MLCSICPYLYLRIWQSSDMSHIAWSNEASRMHYAATARKSITFYKWKKWTLLSKKRLKCFHYEINSLKIRYIWISNMQSACFLVDDHDIQQPCFPPEIGISMYVWKKAHVAFFHFCISGICAIEGQPERQFELLALNILSFKDVCCTGLINGIFWGENGIAQSLSYFPLASVLHTS